MLRRIAISWICVASTALTGCSLAGSWALVDVDPPGMPFPVQAITFGEDQTYTASNDREGRTSTSTGHYKWNGLKLEVAQTGRVPRIYGAMLRLDGKLVLTYEQGDAKVKATLAKQ